MTPRHAIAGLVFIGLSTVLVPRVGASDVMYAATSNGVFKTTDGGASWTASNTGLAGVSVFSLAIDPNTPTTVYAGTFGNRVFKSTDGGQHWRPASTGFADDTALSLAIDPLNPATMYSGTTSWTASNDGLPASSRIFALALHPQRLSR